MSFIGKVFGGIAKLFKPGGALENVDDVLIDTAVGVGRALLTARVNQALGGVHDTIDALPLQEVEKQALRAEVDRLLQAFMAQVAEQAAGKKEATDG